MHRRHILYVILCLVAAAFAGLFYPGNALANSPQTSSGDVRVMGPGVAPQLGFACCEYGTSQMQSLFARPDVLADLEALHAEVAVPTLDFTMECAQVVRRLNQARIPVIAWIVLPKDQGFYLNADNAPEAAARFAEFQAWTRKHDLRWACVGLDIEPNFAELAALKNHRWRLAVTLLRRILDGEHVLRARQAYSALLRRIHSQGYSVQTYQMPFIPAERITHSSLIDRLLDTVDVRSDQDVVMLYTSSAPSIGAGMIWALGPYCQFISIGSTDGNPGAGALNWDEFSRDLIVASHFSHLVGVYDLEGCVRQGFLPLLLTMNWSQSVIIPAESIRKARIMGVVIRTVLRIGTLTPFLGLAIILFVGWLVWRWVVPKEKRVRGS